MEAKQLNVRISPEVHAALDVLHRRYRINKTAAAEMALRDLLAKHEISVAPPEVCVDYPLADIMEGRGDE